MPSLIRAVEELVVISRYRRVVAISPPRNIHINNPFISLNYSRNAKTYVLLFLHQLFQQLIPNNIILSIFSDGNDSY